MTFSNFVRLHWAALRALLVLTVITGLAYPLFVWAVAQLPGLRDHAEGSILTADGKPVGSRLIGQPYTGKDGNPLPQYFQSRPSAAGAGYDPTSSGGSNLGPESIVDTPADPSQLAGGTSAPDAGFKPSLLTTVCSRSAAVGTLEGIDGSRPFCTGGGVGAVLSVIGPRDAHGNVVHPTRVVSVNEPCGSAPAPFLTLYEGVRVECAKYGDDYSIGQTVPIRGAAP
uniref:potassium-transporting ATPase subunit C n=1 Tax=Mycobacterium sp. TaxID=1785 RepID=UPI0026128080